MSEFVPLPCKQRKRIFVIQYFEVGNDSVVGFVRDKYSKSISGSDSITVHCIELSF